MKAHNVSAYVLTVGDVQEDVSKAQVWFDQPQTANPIVIYGVKRLHLHGAKYNGITDDTRLRVRLYSGENTEHEVGSHLISNGVLHI